MIASPNATGPVNSVYSILVALLPGFLAAQAQDSAAVNEHIEGRSGTAVYAITTSDGIMLIDSCYPNEVEQVVIGGIQKLGLDPAQIKVVILPHGHVDHFGSTPPPPTLPKHDMVMTEGQPELQNHPLYDNLQEKLDKLKAPKRGDPNPFVVGQANYKKFLDVMSQCMDAQIARRKE
jgi:glyoxylase-like metal-dependent hydrolase (beta-lactamase superfamily II)